jgi:hypothetical protein
LSNNLIAYYIPSDKAVAIWYAPGCDKIDRAPISPAVSIMHESTAHNLATGLQTLTVFESLRAQVEEGKGISCLLRHQSGAGCCGHAKLMWSIYEAGLKAIKELDWKPRRWVEPECSKPENR